MRRKSGYDWLWISKWSARSTRNMACTRRIHVPAPLTSFAFLFIHLLSYLIFFSYSLLKIRSPVGSLTPQVLFFFFFSFFSSPSPRRQAISSSIFRARSSSISRSLLSLIPTSIYLQGYLFFLSAILEKSPSRHRDRDLSVCFRFRKLPAVDFIVFVMHIQYHVFISTRLLK